MMRIVLTLPGPSSSLGAEVRTPVIVCWEYKATMGEPQKPIDLARGEVQFVSWLELSGITLEMVQNHFRDSGLPMLTSHTKVYYYGDWARFIVGNLRVRGDE
jgi:hypothetical protein